MTTAAVRSSIGPAATTDAASEYTGGRALGALLLGGIVIGCAPILVRLSEVGSVTTAFWRMTLALVPLTLLFGNARRQDAAAAVPRRASEHLAAALPGLFLAADLATWHVSLHLTSVANSTLLVNMAPVLVTLAAWLFLGQPVTRTFLAGLVMSVAGIVVLRGGSAALGDGNIRGDALALGAASFYAGYILFLSRARQVFPTTVIMLWSTVAGALATLPLAAAVESQLLPATLAGWVVVIALALVVHVAGQGLVTFSLAWLPATFSSLTLLIQPVVAAVLAWVMLGERLSGFQIAGGVIVIAGIVMAKRG